MVINARESAETRILHTTVRKQEFYHKRSHYEVEPRTDRENIRGISQSNAIQVKVFLTQVHPQQCSSMEEKTTLISIRAAATGSLECQKQNASLLAVLNFVYMQLLCPLWNFLWGGVSFDCCNEFPLDLSVM